MSKNVKTGAIVWIPENNFGKHENKFDSEKERVEHALMIAHRGWVIDQPIRATPFSKEGIKKAVEYLQTLWAKLCKLTLDTVVPGGNTDGTEMKLSPSDVKEGFRATFLMKGDTVLPGDIELDGVFAFQRGSALYLANAILIKRGQKPIAHLPVNVVTYDNQAERVADCMAENFLKTEGFKDVTNHWPTIMKGIQKYHEALDPKQTPATFAQVLDLISSGAATKKVGRAQKAHAIYLLDLRFPEAKLIERITNAGIDGKGNDVGQNFAEKLDRKYLSDLERGTRVTVPKDVEAKGEDDVMEYLEDPESFNDAKVEPMTIKVFETRANLSQNQMVKYIYKAFSTGDVESLDALSKVSKEVNAIMKDVFAFPTK